MNGFAKKKFEYVLYLVILLTIGFLFFFCLGEKGYILEKDSGAFLGNKVPPQYFIYPQFLKLCRSLFGEGHYLEWVSIIQGLFSLIVSFITTEYFRKNYELEYRWGVLIFVCTFGPYAYSLPQSVSSHSIMTEGLTFPLFYIWMICALQIYLRKDNRWFILLFVVTLVMAFTRPQLTLFFIICFVMIIERVFVYVYSKIKVEYRKKIIGFCIALGIFVCVLGIKIFLVFIQYNIYPQMTDAVAGRVFCAAVEEDAELFEGRDRDLFLGIYDEIEKMESRQIYFRTGIRQWEDIVNATNNNTKTLGWIIRPYYEEIETAQLNDVKGRLAYTMLLEHWPDYISMTMALMLQSFVVSIFVHPEAVYVLGYVIALLLYLMVIVSVIWCKKRYDVNNKYIVPLWLTLLVISLMCIVTNVLFMGLQRYVVYPFGFFYMSLIPIYVGVQRK